MEKNKTGKYLKYAIGEIFLVVIGILIALSINNWNEWRKERKSESNVLLDLKSNLERNIILTKNAISDLEHINNSSVIVRKTISGGMPYADSLNYHFGQATRSGSYILELNTDGYQSFKNIGFELLSSIDLKNEILSLFEVTYRGFGRKAEVASAMWSSNPYWWKEYLIFTSEKGYMPIEYQHLLEDRGFLSIVEQLLEQRGIVLQESKMVLTETQRVLKLIKDELMKSD